jgi:hypothetical protein
MAKYWVQYVFVGELEADDQEEARNKIADQIKKASLVTCLAENRLRLYKSVLTKDDPVSQEKIIEDAKTRLAMESNRFA